MLIEKLIPTIAQSAEFSVLTDAQWKIVQDLFPNPAKRTRGKPHCSWRTVLNSILWVLSNGSKWGALKRSPDFASKSSAHRWFVLWEKTGFLSDLLETLQAESEVSISYPKRRQRAASA